MSLCKNCGTREAQEAHDYCEPCENRWLEIKMTPDEQEALSRRYSNDIIILLPLKSGNIAVFNNESRKLCGIIEDYDAFFSSPSTWTAIKDAWSKPVEIKSISRNIDLEELGLL